MTREPIRLAMIELKTPEQIGRMRKAGKVVGGLLEALKAAVRPGVTTAELDELARQTIVRLGGKVAFKGYRGFPGNICISVNDQVVHGIPSKRALNEGDIVGLDVGAIVEEYYADAAVTVPVGSVSEEAKRLIRITETSLREGIAKARPGNRLSDISHAVQSCAEQGGYSVVREFVGHGIGKQLHEPPEVPNYGAPGFGPELKAGMVLAIEPMVNAGKPAIRVLDDGWTAVTKDGSLSAHFEHTVAITEQGPEILTKQ
jgi:methionyl aminopeptidase